MKNENRTERISVRVTSGLKKKVEEKAKSENRSVASYLLNLVMEDLKKTESDKE